jgi:hypothetical protein
MNTLNSLSNKSGAKQFSQKERTRVNQRSNNFKQLFVISTLS